GHESCDGVQQPWMGCQAGKTRVMVRIGEDAMDERDRIGPVLLCDAFQALRQGQLWAARRIGCEESARDPIDGLRDARLHLVDLGRGKNPGANGIATWGNGHGVSPSACCSPPPPMVARQAVLACPVCSQRSLVWCDHAGWSLGDWATRPLG